MTDHRLSYVIKPVASSRFSLGVAKTGFMKTRKHNFIFNDYHGSVEIDPNNRENSTVKFSVQSNSVACPDKWLKETDRKKILDYVINDGIAAGTYPDIAFVLTKIKQKSDTTFDVYVP